MGQEVDQWVRELQEAGWKPYRNGHNLWQAPCGCLYRGPFKAWTVMLAIKANDLVCPNEHK